MKTSKMYPAYFLIGSLLLYGALYLLPSILGIGYSFTDWSAYSDKVNFLGFKHMFDNYLKAFSVEKYIGYLKNTLLFTFVTTIVKDVVGLALAVLLIRRIKFLNFHRAVLFIPAVLSALIVGMIFRSVLNPEVGLLNSFLRLLGIEGPQWLTNPDIAFWSVMAVDIWKGMGYIMTIFIAGLMSISPTYYEAADIDGAGGWQKFRWITLPMLMPTLTVATVLNVIYGLRVFDIVWALTSGGPGYATEVLYTGIYKEFSYGKFAMGTTLSTIMFVVMVIVGYFLIRTMNRNEVEG
jgi:raffinose/stachyose/melibiose transport system permease protein